MTETFQPYQPATMPAAVLSYLDAHDEGRHADAVATFAPGATVRDDGQRHVGIEAISRWVERSAGAFSYTSTRLGQQVGAGSAVVVQIRLDGDFPGGTVTLRYAFELEAGLISALVIEV